MTQDHQSDYSFSIEPFWNFGSISQECVSPSGQISVLSFQMAQETLRCVPGNGQIGIMLRGPDGFAGQCYGALEERKDIPVYGITSGNLVRFSPGTFSKICNIPAALIAPEGTLVEDIFSVRQMGEMKDALAAEDPGGALMRLFGGWLEYPNRAKAPQEQQLAQQVTRLIWERRGRIRVRDLEEETTYSTRHLQDVVGRQVGLTPKQMCRQIRFQNALRLLSEKRELNMSWAAQVLGYSDQAHYCREFKMFSGLSPTEYHKQAVK